MDPHIITSVPQNQLRHKRFFEELAKTEIPDNSKSPEPINEVTPKPL